MNKELHVIEFDLGFNPKKPMWPFHHEYLDSYLERAEWHRECWGGVDRWIVLGIFESYEEGIEYGNKFLIKNYKIDCDDLSRRMEKRIERSGE